MDQESAERIEQEMKATRTALTEKVSALENQVSDTIHGAASAVQESVQAVKCALDDSIANASDKVRESVANVQSTVATVSQSVKQTLDFPEHVRNNPWTAVLTATACGVATGYCFAGRRQSSSAEPQFSPRPRSFVAEESSAYERRRPSVWDDIIDALSRELKGITEAALTKLSLSVRERLDDGIQRIVAPNVAAKTDDAHSRNGRDYAFESG